MNVCKPHGQFLGGFESFALFGPDHGAGRGLVDVVHDLLRHRAVDEHGFRLFCFAQCITEL